MDDLCKGRQFEREIIVLCVRWYLRYKFGLRDLVELMADRGLTLAGSFAIVGPPQCRNGTAARRNLGT